MEILKLIKPLTGAADWPVWKRRMYDFLEYHEGCIEVIEGKLEQPIEPVDDADQETKDEYSKKSVLYRKANSYAKQSISAGVSEAVYQKIMDKKTARDMWNSLKSQFEATEHDQIFSLCDEFFSFKWQVERDVNAHIAKLRQIFVDLNAALKNRNEPELSEILLVSKCLNILPSEFQSFKSSGWMSLSQGEKKTFEDLVPQLAMFERNFTGMNTKQDGEALVATKIKRLEKADGESKGNKRFPGNCNYCKKPGHMAADCRKLKYNKEKKEKESGNKTSSAESKVAFITLDPEAFVSTPTDNHWYFDNGATRHICRERSWFSIYSKFENIRSIYGAGKDPIPAYGSGEINILSTVGNKKHQLVLRNVWYAPTIPKNLFSVLAAHDQNPECYFVSRPTSCALKIGKETFVTGDRQVQGTLYRANFEVDCNQIQVHLTIPRNIPQDQVLQLFHERFGHQDRAHIKKLLLDRFGISVKNDTFVCEPCIFGKSHKLEFGSRVPATKAGELLCGDVCGPFDPSFSGKRFMIVFKDAYTKFRFVSIAKEKSEVAEALETVLEMCKVQKHPVIEFMSDNGGEFTGHKIDTILKRYGVNRRTTAPYTPEQNGIVERDNRTIVEMGRTYKYANPEVKFPSEIWAELVTTATYILNRTGKSSVPGVSPFELWFGKKPRISHLRVIPSVCYAHVPAQQRRKMSKKAIKGYLVGYDGEERYRIYVPERNNIILSRDVVFDEHPFGARSELSETPRENDSLPADLVKADSEAESHTESRAENIEHGKANVEQDSELEEDESCKDDEDNATELKTEPRVTRSGREIKTPARYKEFAMMIDIPTTFEEAVKAEDSEKWQEAMQRELNSLKENETWELTTVPPNTPIIPCKWVFTTKLRPDGTTERYKARLVAKGFRQKYGRDYEETFSPVAKLTTIRSLLSIAASKNLHMYQFDVSTAFLYGKLKETVYMTQPPGFDDNSGKVCRLFRSLYGLKQSPRCWNQCIGEFLCDQGFVQSQEDPCLYIQRKGKDFLILVLYVDDGLLASTSKKDLRSFVSLLEQRFKIMKKEPTYFLGLEIHQDKSGIKICQCGFIRKILKKFNFADCHPVNTPIVNLTENPEAKVNTEFPYRQAVGSLMYLMLGTRPDISFAVGVLSRHLEAPTNDDVVRLKRVLRYLAGTIEYAIQYKNTNNDILECYSDADFAGCTDTRRSTSGAIIKFAGGAVSWFSNRQATIADSTAEAEVVAATETAKEMVWLNRLFSEMIGPMKLPVLYIDNVAAIRISKNPESHRRTKHIERKKLMIREFYNNQKLTVDQVSSEGQLADIMTKPLVFVRFSQLRKELGIVQV